MPVIETGQTVYNATGRGVERGEYGWLIERADSPVCEPEYHGWDAGHSGDDGPGLSWTKDHNEALRFARKIDAERYAQDAGWNNVRICEHGWIAPRALDLAAIAEQVAAEIKPPNAPGDDCTVELAIEYAELRAELTRLRSQVREAERVRAEIGRDDVVEAVLAEIRVELTKARSRFKPFNSPHEGYAVIREELD